MRKTDIVNGEILNRLGPFTCGQQFHVMHPVSPQKHLMAQLLRLTYRWLQPEKSTTTAVADGVAMDRFMWALPSEAKNAVANKPLRPPSKWLNALSRQRLPRP